MIFSLPSCDIIAHTGKFNIFRMFPVVFAVRCVMSAISMLDGDALCACCCVETVCEILKIIHTEKIHQKRLLVLVQTLAAAVVRRINRAACLLSVRIMHAVTSYQTHSFSMSLLFRALLISIDKYLFRCNQADGESPTQRKNEYSKLPFAALHHAHLARLLRVSFLLSPPSQLISM